jgi:glutathionylspermidine synthase
MRRYGVKLWEWRDMSDDDRFEYLAYDREYQDSLDKLLEPFFEKIRKNEGIVTEAFYTLFVQSL